jgi:ABC-type transport system substrate-binding protein
MYPVSSWHTPSSTDDGLYEEFGPRASQLLIKIYSDYTAELNAFKNKEFDIMDWTLEPIDYQWFETNDPDHSQYGTAFYNEYDLFEYEMNCQVLPTSIISVRQAFAHMVDKQYFIDTWLPGAAIKVDSVLGSTPNWYNPACTDRYNLQPRTTMTPVPDDPSDWEAAYNLLVSDLGEPILDPEDPNYYTWTWPSPFPTPDPTGTYPPVANGHLLMYYRGRPRPQATSATFFKDCCETAMPAILPTLGLPKARLHVDLYIVPLSIVQVMGYYRYHLYNGGWSLSRDPDFLQFYTTALIAKPAEYGNNYVMYSNPAYDNEVNLMLMANSVGNSTNPCDALYHAYLAQDIMENDEPVIPMWTFSGYKAYLANWRGVVNQVGFGTNSWWTFLNAHKLGSEGGDVIRYGWAGDLLSLNVISAQWLWDWDVLNRIYDTLITYSPYDETQDLPYLAKSWEFGTWQLPWSGTGTKITFHLREDVWWQDVPYKGRSTITYDNGHEIDGPFTNMPLTPIDVAFSLEYVRDIYDSWHAWMISPLDHVSVNLDLWSSLWRSPVNGLMYNETKPEWYTADVDYGIPWQYDFIEHDPTLDSETITVYVDYFMPWQILHWIGGIPITPYHIWRNILQSTALSVDTWANDIVYGTGPWILFSRTSGVEMTLIPYTTGQTYRGITLERSYFYQPVRPPEDEDDGEGINGITAWFRNELHNYGNTALNVSVYFDYDFEYWNDTAWTSIPGLPSGTTAAQTVTIAPGTTVRIGEPSVAKIPSGIKWGDYIRIHDSLHWTYVTPSPPVWQAFTGCYGDFTGTTPEATAYWSEVVHYHPGDFAGKTPAPPSGGYWSEPYLAANGVVSIGDVGPITAHWQKTIPPNNANVEYPALSYDIGINDNSGITKRADMDGNNVIAVGDVGLITANWQHTWTHNPPLPIIP